MVVVVVATTGAVSLSPTTGLGFAVVTGAGVAVDLADFLDIDVSLLFKAVLTLDSIRTSPLLSEPSLRGGVIGWLFEAIVMSG